MSFDSKFNSTAKPLPRSSPPRASKENNLLHLQCHFADSYGEVASLLRPFVSDHATNDAALAEEVLSQDTPLPPPLTRHDVSVIACGLYRIHQARDESRGFSYSDVDDLTARFSPSKLPMNTAMIYKTLRSLVDRGLVTEVGRQVSSYGRLSDHFVINQKGRIAFRLAVANASLLKNCQGSTAA